MACALLFGCGESADTEDDADPVLEGDLCVDPNDACCCSEEGQFVENGPSCIINFAGSDVTALTLELVTLDGSTVLPQLMSAAECPSSGGWWSEPSADFIRIELCDETCSVRRSETTRLRVLWGCPATPC